MAARRRTRPGGFKKDSWSDHYTHAAQKTGYPARSVFKLQEIQRKFRLIKKGHRVLDLGCAPGSWLLYAAELTGPRGWVTGLDLKPVTVSLPPFVAAFVMDVFSEDPADWDAVGENFDVVLSDMAPDTTGARDVDAARSLQLCDQAFSIAQARLTPGGSFVCKIFFGADAKAFTETVAEAFAGVKLFKPAASRKASREIYIVATGKK
ncbi:MAG: RlmE family RNA methyltransferase [Deltaproteobacteria bacterium]|nr:RlmE family RNA methyltransferase [Deltaproteobacteria bacterium]